MIIRFFFDTKLSYTFKHSYWKTMISYIRRVFKFIHWLYLQYLLNTALYMLEPWERLLFSTLLFAILSTALYSALVFLPHHIRSMEKFSNNSIMNVTRRTPYLNTSSKNDDESMMKQTRKSSWFNCLYQTLQHLYMQFLLVTTLYVMEPWERILMISIFFCVISLVTYSAFVYIPFHIHNILHLTIPNLSTVLIR
ncbi:unnamed protein product [Adineta ricciae]|uniref:Serine palmitoyltransferase small subunit B n=1 Tax=Adineta ricciae TaxID=249248 RepID=A0A814D798_ADIRI|nr:unnamed protein product [Adineta ricciae]